MLPVVAIVGRPNVGKSTLFNRLTGTRDALVADYPGLTRDRLYGYARAGDSRALLIDTGGIGADQGALKNLLDRQVALAVDEADVVLLLTDATEGVTAADHDAVTLVRQSGKPVLLVTNKAEGRATDEVAGEFYELGLGDPFPISALRGDRCETLLEQAVSLCELKDHEPAPEGAGTRIAVVGRPNVGKSTLINRYIGEERLLAYDEAGTTRDAIGVPFEVEGHAYTLIDTAGIRRKARVRETIEKFSIVKALEAVEAADAVIVLIDAREGLTEQDVSLIGLVVERGSPLTLGVNKWDGLDRRARNGIRNEIERRLPYLDFVDVHFISALHGSGIDELLASATEAAQAARIDLATRPLTEALESAIESHPPPLVRGRRIKLSYAHQGGKRPPVIVIHGNQTKSVPGSYRRYLASYFRRVFRLRGTPIRLQFRSSKNPFAGRRNKLTPRQEAQTQAPDHPPAWQRLIAPL